LGADPALRSTPEKKQRICDVMLPSVCVDLSFNKHAVDKLEVRGDIGTFVSMPALMNNGEEAQKVLEVVKDHKPIGGDIKVYQIVKAVQHLELPKNGLQSNLFAILRGSFLKMAIDRNLLQLLLLTLCTLL
jgi:hypothetical protein